MDVIFLLRLTLFFYSLSNHRFSVVSADQGNLQVITDQWTVEKFAVQRASCKHKLINLIRKPFRKRKETICHRSPDVKVAFCGHILPMAEYELKFGYWNEDNLECTRKIFHIRHLQKGKPDHFKLKMYTCPDFLYTDLETEMDKALHEKYYVSKGLEVNSAIVYRQTKVGGNNIYPIEYFSKIVFDKLGSPPVEPPSLHSQIDQIKVVDSQVLMDSAVTDFGDDIKHLETYEKFRRTFFSINICGLRKSQKIFICRLSIRSSILRYGTLLYEGYDEDECRKRRIRIRLPDREEVAKKKPKKKDLAKDKTKKQELLAIREEEEEDAIEEARTKGDSDEAETKTDKISLFESRSERRARRHKEKERSRRQFRYVQLSVLFCPREAPVNDVKTNDNFVYLSSNLTPSSVTLVTRRNERGQHWATTSLIRNLSTDRIVADNRRARFGPYPSEAERRDHQQKLRRTPLSDLEDGLNLMGGSVQTPITMAKSRADELRNRSVVPMQIRVVKEDRLVEDIVTSYSEIRQMKFVYKRFLIMHPSLGICELPNKLKKQLCHGIPSEYQMDESSFLSDDIDYGCFRRQVQLRVREIENLKTRYTKVWMCPTPLFRITYNNYYIAKSHLKNTVIAFRSASVYKKGDIYPDAALYEIDREKLAQNFLLDDFPRPISTINDAN